MVDIVYMIYNLYRPYHTSQPDLQTFDREKTKIQSDSHHSRYLMIFGPHDFLFEINDHMTSNSNLLTV